jgi:SPASM domain peptide maturase of grasp-with-spasm system
MELTYLRNNKDKYIHVFSCCIPVKGHERGAIYDIQREEIELVPNTMIDFLEYIKNKKVSSVLEEFESDKMAGKYLDFLEKNEFVFYSNTVSFPELSAKSINEDTSVIQFMTITLSEFINNNLDRIIRNINELGVKRLHIHITNQDCMGRIHEFLHLLEHSRVTNVSFSIPYQKIDKKLYNNNRLKALYLFNSPKEKVEANNEVTNFFITVNDAKMFLPKFNINTVDVNSTAYNIGKNYNLSIYKTVFVDEFGEIKFNISDKTSYGNITDSFKEITAGTIKKLSMLWNIKKDDIAPCNICEFRYCCTVTHIPFKTDNGYAVSCNYNPHSAELN